MAAKKKKRKPASAKRRAPKKARRSRVVYMAATGGFISKKEYERQRKLKKYKGKRPKKIVIKLKKARKPPKRKVRKPIKPEKIKPRAEREERVEPAQERYPRILDTEPPRELKPRARDVTLLRIAAEQQREAFARTAFNLLHYDDSIGFSYRVVVNKDGSVDGQGRVSDLPRRVSINDLLLDLESDLWVIPPGHWPWLAFVGDLEPRKTIREKAEGAKESKERAYLRFKGMSKVAIYPQKPDEKKPYMFVTARGIWGRLKAKKRKRPEMILLNLYWSLDGTKPTRR